MPSEQAISPMNACGFHFDTTYTGLPRKLFSEGAPEPVVSPNLIIVNSTLAESMGLDFSSLTKAERGEMFSGNQLPEGTTPFSQAYAGHQYGHFTILGDGRAHLWGEHVAPDGRRFDIQFKGSGRTPYSRNGDGKAALGPMLREYIVSEAMHHLGIPTTRSLAVVTTGEFITRDRILPGAILTRVAQSHIRVGTFEFAATHQGGETLKALMDYTLKRHFPHLIDDENKALKFIRAVMEKQATLIVDWMRVGFIHGVMNTDNMLLCGETIDYGPCAFMDSYDPQCVFSSIDSMGRYAFLNQSKIAQWNLGRFAETLLPLINKEFKKAVKLVEETINQFPEIYHQKWLRMMGSKLGLFGSDMGDERLISDLLGWMEENHLDYTNTFRDLGHEDKPTGGTYEKQDFKDWYSRWRIRLRKTEKPLSSSLSLMEKTNPVVIPRNHKVEEVLEASYRGDSKPLERLLSVLKDPYTDREASKPYQEPPKPNERVYQTFCGT